MQQAPCQSCALPKEHQTSRSDRNFAASDFLPPMQLHAWHCVPKETGDVIGHLPTELVESVFMDVPNEHPRTQKQSTGLNGIADNDSPAIESTIPVCVQGQRLLVGPVPGGKLPSIKVLLLLARVRQGIDVATGDALLWVSDRGGKNWLLVVPGGDVAAKRVLAVISSVGAIRSDFAACYVLRKKLGHGTNAIVYSASKQCDKNGQTGSHAVKIPFVDREMDSKDLPPTWLTELEMLASCQGHPNILKLQAVYCGSDITHTDEEAGEKPQWAIVTEKCSAGDLWDWIVSSRGLSEEQAKKVVRGILQGLDFIHKRALVHRDVKPENVLLRRDGRPVLADFGTACRICDTDELQRQTGSPGYIAPEIYAGRCYSNAIDVFSAGALLYFALSMQLPFSGRTPAHTRSKTLKGIVDFTKSSVFLQVEHVCRNFILQLLSCDAERPTVDEALRNPWFEGHIRSRTSSQRHIRKLAWGKNKEHLRCKPVLSVK